MLENNQAVVVKETSSWEEALEREKWVTPTVDIYETEDEFVLHTSMPGVSKENVKIKVEDDSLVLMGRINYEEAKSRKYILRESRIGNFYRKFKISDSIDIDKVDAKLENGVMVVVLPKNERIKPRSIEIK
jgi:HSP20 family protein